MRLLLTCLLFLTLPAMAANWYVAHSGDGSTGADWTHAWTDVTNISWGGIGAGDNVWIAGGTYGQLSIGASGSSGSPISIYRVRTTNSTPAAAAGWNSSFDSQVTIVLASASANGWWVVDGQVPYNGILITNANPMANNCFTVSGTSSNFFVLNCDIGGPIISPTSQADSGNSYNCFYYNGTAGVWASNVNLSYCQFHNQPTLVTLQYIQAITISHNKFYANFNGGNNSQEHPDVIQFQANTNVVVSYNEFYNYYNENLLINNSSALYPCSNFQIYGNLFHDAQMQNYTATRIAEAQYTPMHQIVFYNNTCVNLPYGINPTGINSGSWDSTCVSSNNISIGVTNWSVDFGNGATHDYNLYDSAGASPSSAEAHGITAATTGIFQNYSGQNYQIVSTVASAYPRNKGVYIGSVLTDFYGVAYANPPSMGYAEYNTGNTTPNNFTIGSGSSSISTGTGNGTITTP